VKIGITKQTQKDLGLISDLVAKGKILPVIDREYSLNEIRDAHSYVEKGHKLGNVILSIN
jgi:NADPH:quinone reductase-like Zn-dependent oxidoreductase